MGRRAVRTPLRETSAGGLMGARDRPRTFTEYSDIVDILRYAWLRYGFAATWRGPGARGRNLSLRPLAADPHRQAI
jgi:hypothetical protein